MGTAALSARLVAVALLITLALLPSPASALPGAPRIVVPNAGATAITSTPAIYWLGDAHDMYEVRPNTTNDPTDADVWDSGPVSIPADRHDLGPLANGSYFVFVRLHSADGWGPWSSLGHGLQIAAPVEPIKKGWVLIREDVPYHLDLLTKAREYHVNQVQLSHNIMMYAWQPINTTTMRGKLNQLIQAATPYRRWAGQTRRSAAAHCRHIFRRLTQPRPT